MKISKFRQFISENMQEPPEEYVKIALLKLKKKIDSFFESEGEMEKSEKGSLKNAIEKGKEGKKKESKISFKELGVQLESSEFSKYSAVYDSITIKFSDEDNFYSLYITVPLEDAVPTDKEKDFSDNDIKNCYIKFKKYDTEKHDLLGQITKTVEIKEIDEEFLVNLKIELDEEYSDPGEDLEIETE